MKGDESVKKGEGEGGRNKVWKGMEGVGREVETPRSVNSCVRPCNAVLLILVLGGTVKPRYYFFTVPVPSRLRYYRGTAIPQYSSTVVRYLPTCRFSRKNLSQFSEDSHAKNQFPRSHYYLTESIKWKSLNKYRRFAGAAGAR